MAEKMSDDEEMDEDDGFFVPHGYLSSDEENQLTEGKNFSHNTQTIITITIFTFKPENS